MAEDLKLSPGDRVSLASAFALDRDGMTGSVIAETPTRRGEAPKFDVQWDDGRLERGVLSSVLVKGET